MAELVLVVGDDNDNEEDHYKYHEPIWLRGIRDPSGVLEGAILAHKIVDNVEVNVDDSFFTEQNDARAFVERLASLNGLKSFRLLPDKFNIIYDFPVDILTTLLRRAQGLQMISLCALDWIGSPDDFAKFIETLRNHSSLCLVRLIRCRFPENSNVLQDFIANLAQVPKLREVELCGAEESSLGILSSESMERISHSEMLEKLRLDNFELSEDHFSVMLQWLERNNNRLTGVSLSSCQLSSPSLHRLARMLSSNGTLEELSFCLTRTHNQTYTDESFEAISQSLHDNTSLRQFRLTGSNGWPKLNDRIQTAFLTMLRRNCTLERLSLFDSADLQRDIDFWLALNRMGRKRVMNENATKEDWLQVITWSLVDLDCIYFFLSMKPELLDGMAL
jgi:3-methyladenine DNA glycosylase AlkC